MLFAASVTHKMSERLCFCQCDCGAAAAGRPRPEASWGRKYEDTTPLRYTTALRC